jgi:outer membrane lipoprotein-sorting protein
MKIKLVLSAIALTFAFAIQAQTVDEIIAKYFENTGGIAKWKTVQGMRLSAKVNQQGMEIPIEMVQLKDGRQAQKITFQGKDIMQGVFDGKVLWSHNFMNMKAEKSDTEATENLKLDIGEFPDPFLTYKERGLKAEFLGKETIDGTETLKIKLTKKPIKVDGKQTENIVFYYFDAENFVPLMSESEIKSGPMKGKVSQSKMSDYQEVEGLMIPFSLSQGIKGDASQPLTVTKVELNPKVDDKFFAFPEGK